MKTAMLQALAAMVAAAGVVAALGQATAQTPTAPVPSVASPIFGVLLPKDYRRWELVAPSHEAGTLDELRGIVGNELAMRAYWSGTLPFPDGAVIAKLAWKHVPSSEFDGAFVPGRATTVQIMVKDSKKYAASGGWGFGRFVDGKPVDEAQHQTCVPCHRANVKDHDLVFTRLAK